MSTKKKQVYALLQGKYLILSKPAENDKKTAYVCIFHAVRMQPKEVFSQSPLQ